MFGRLAIKLRFPGSDFVCFIAQSSVDGGAIRSTVEPSEVGQFGSLASAAKWMELRGLEEGRPLPVGVGLYPCVEPFDAEGLTPAPWWLRGALVEIPPASSTPEGKPPGYVKPVPRPKPPARPVQASLF